MESTYSFYDEFNLVVLKGAGQLAVKDFKVTYDEIDPRIKSGFLELIDLRDANLIDIKKQDMHDIIEFDDVNEVVRSARLAIVVANDYDYAAARQYAAHVDIPDHEIEIFRDISEAKSWLGIKELEIE